MKVAIIGTGGVGGYFGGRLAQNGNEVTFLARGEHLKAIQQKGLKVKSILGDFHIKQVRATDKINELGKVDLVILGVKAWQVKEVAKDLKSIMSQKTVVIPLQNGISAVEEISKEIKPKNIIGGLCRIISEIESPGVINHFGVEPTIVIGELNGESSNRILKINEILNDSGINSKITEDISAELWKKFMGICVSGLLAVTRSTYGVVRELKETRDLMKGVISEIYTVSQKVGINLEPNIIDKTIASIDTYPYDSTSSLTRDVWEGRPSEINYQNGSVVKLGKKYGVKTQVNEFIYNCILPVELKARKK
ncbi:2-dehydropantoate 2-reductase [Mycoplasmatota bacterium]|nr:2-dehydropantoate 2-reductase [Mycoplasmatota bacterium]